MTNSEMTKRLFEIAKDSSNACAKYCRDEYRVRQEIFIACCRAANMAYKDAAEHADRVLGKSNAA